MVTEMQMQSTLREGRVILARMTGRGSGKQHASGAALAIGFVLLCMLAGGTLALLAAGLMRLQWHCAVTTAGGAAFYALALMVVLRSPGPRWSLASAGALRARLKTITTAGMLGRPVRARGQVAWLTEEGLLGQDFTAYRWEEFGSYRLGEDQSGFLLVELMQTDNRTSSERVRNWAVGALTLAGALLPLVSAIAVLVPDPLRLDGLGALLAGATLLSGWLAVVGTELRHRIRRRRDGSESALHLLIDPEQFSLDEVNELLSSCLPVCAS